jgi:carotenoid cleavage dioxygenase-like enzyme
MAAPATQPKPFHLQGNFAPVRDEVTAVDLPVEGALPPELTGLYARQTANPAGADPNSDEGWVMSYVYDENSNETEFVILNASDLKKDPVARVKLPQRVPHGFHGSWMPDTD